MEFDLPVFDTSPAAIEVKRRLKINWLLKTGQAKQGPEDFLRDLFQTSLSEYISKLECLPKPSPVPSEIKFYFSWRFAHGLHPPQSWSREIKIWPPRFPISETEKTDILTDARLFLQGLALFIEDTKDVILQTGKQKSSIPGVQAPSHMSLDLDRDGILHLTIANVEIAALGIVSLLKLLDGYPWSALKNCPQCEKVFFTLSQRQKFCSVECNSKAKYVKRTKKTGYPEERRMIARKYYLKKNKCMTDTEIAERWRSEGIEKKWIKRLLPEAS